MFLFSSFRSFLAGQCYAHRLGWNGTALQASAIFETTGQEYGGLDAFQ